MAHKYRRLYVHIPFCLHRCSFCHYPVKLGELTAEKDRYLTALEKEMDIYMRDLCIDKIKVRSILVGGGALSSIIITVFPGFGTLAASLMLTYFFIGGVEPLLMSLTSERVNSKNRGFLFGIQTMVGSFAWFVSPMLGSWVSIKYSISSIFLLFSILLALTFIITSVIKRKIR